MATTLRPELQSKLDMLAERTHVSADEALEEALNQALAYNDWFERKVKEGLAAAERGELIPDEQVLAWIEKREQKEQS